MESIFSRLERTEKSKEDLDFIQGAFLYVSGMHASLESIGTKIIEMERYVEAISNDDVKSMVAGQNKFEEILKSIFILVDNFLDSITAFSRLYQAKGQEFDFIRTVMELHAKRDLLMKIGNEYMSKLIKGSSDSVELQFFLSDFLDSLLNEAYRLQINKLLKAFKVVLDQQGTIEELW
jgi:hypothetical protein